MKIKLTYYDRGFTTVYLNEGEADKIIKKFQNFLTYEDVEEEIYAEDVNLPNNIEDSWPKIHLDYLQNERKFDPDFIIPKYNLKAIYNLGDKYNFSIFIPITENGRIVTFTTRSIYKDGGYFHCPKKESIVPVKSILYNIDSVKHKMIITEGPTDVWRIGDGSVAVFGKQFTDKQVLKVVEKDPKEVYILFDSEPEAIELAHKMANKLEGLIPYVEVLNLSEGDPSDLSDEFVRELRIELNI